MIQNVTIYKTTKEAPASFSLSFQELTPNWTPLHGVSHYKKQNTPKRRMTAKDWIEGRYFFTLIPNLSLEDLRKIRDAIDNQINNLDGQEEETETRTVHRTERI